MDTLIYDAGDYVRIPRDAMVAGPNIRPLRDIGAIGHVLPNYNGNTSGIIFWVAFPDRMREEGEVVLRFGQDDLSIELVDVEAMNGVEAYFGEPPAKEPKPRKRLSRMDCTHRRRMFLSGQHGIGDGISYRHDVTLCPDCGEFNVFGYKNGEKFDIQFTLNTDEAVAAAGVYLELLREDEDDDTEQ